MLRVFQYLYQRFHCNSQPKNWWRWSRFWGDHDFLPLPVFRFVVWSYCFDHHAVLLLMLSGQSAVSQRCYPLLFILCQVQITWNGVKLQQWTGLCNQQCPNQPANQKNIQMIFNSSPYWGQLGNIYCWHSFRKEHLFPACVEYEINPHYVN